MKKTNDLTILLLVLGLFVALIGVVYYVRDSDGVVNNGFQSGMSSYKVQQSGQKGDELKQSPVGSGKPQRVLPTKIVIGIDVILVTGLILGLSLIFQGRFKFAHICLSVGIFVTIIDIFLRFSFKLD